MAEKNYGKALTTINEMYDQFELTSEQVVELSSLQEYIHWMQQIEDCEETIYKLSEKDINY